jgi:flagellar biosynthetic protein FlhB|uniref:Flagellar biosynthetic protein FlhB n=1 Tax=Desulfobacca acetoxidans TaxID=60893 RepID=A0A7V6DNL2_9BACT
MADEAYHDRTEEPTPKRQAEARKKGQIARSRDLSASLVLLSSLGVLTFWSASMGIKIAALVRTSLEQLRPGLVTPASVSTLALRSGLAMGQILAPVWLCLIVTAIAANCLQGGWIFSTERLTPDLTRIQLFGGLKRLFSGKSLVELAKSLAKVCFIGLLMYSFFKSRVMNFLTLTHQDTGQLLSLLESTSLQLSGKVILLLLFLGALDYFYQRYSFTKNLRMTKQEVKDEMRQVEGDPRVKARMRSLMRQLASRRMMAAVPEADVVVTNPTRLAIALRYDSATMIAPQVVAKGRGFVALKIIALAQEFGVPRVENRPLARSLFRQVEVGETIPTSLYRAAAEVLAYIYSLKAAAGGAR